MLVKMFGEDLSIDMAVGMSEMETVLEIPEEDVSDGSVLTISGDGVTVGTVVKLPEEDVSLGIV